jgi:hypothetical protein
MSRPAVVIPPEMSVTQALTLLRRRAIRRLVVDLSRKGQTSYRIITTSDILDQIVGEDPDPAAMPGPSGRRANCQEDEGAGYPPPAGRGRARHGRGDDLGEHDLLEVKEAGWRPMG